jgi:hypothetical protein
MQCDFQYRPPQNEWPAGFNGDGHIFYGKYKGTSAWPDPCGDWQLDDICNSYPPYSMHLAPAMPAAAPMSAAVQDIDRHWVS